MVGWWGRSQLLSQGLTIFALCRDPITHIHVLYRNDIIANVIRKFRTNNPLVTIVGWVFTEGGETE